MVSRTLSCLLELKNARHITHYVIKPRFVSSLAFYDVVSTIHLALDQGDFMASDDPYDFLNNGMFARFAGGRDGWQPVGIGSSEGSEEGGEVGRESAYDSRAEVGPGKYCPGIQCILNPRVSN